MTDEYAEKCGEDQERRAGALGGERRGDELGSGVVGLVAAEQGEHHT